MPLVKMLTESESIYKQPKKLAEVATTKVAVDSVGNEYFFEFDIDDKRMMINRPARGSFEKFYIRSPVWTKNFKTKMVRDGYVLKPLK